MNIILLSGGSGQRLWPLSNEIRSKQFIKIFHTEDGGLESMVQRVYRQIREADPEAKITIATSKAQICFHPQPAGRKCRYQHGALQKRHLPGDCTGGGISSGCAGSDGEKSR